MTGLQWRALVCQWAALGAAVLAYAVCPWPRWALAEGGGWLGLTLAAAAGITGGACGLAWESCHGSRAQKQIVDEAMARMRDTW